MNMNRLGFGFGGVASLVVVLVLAVGCGSSHTADPDGGMIALPDSGPAPDSGPSMDAGPAEVDAGGGPIDMCGDVRGSTRIYNGHITPEVVPLRPGQVWAVGQMGPGCSGTLIAPTWALTATHCGIRAGDEFCIGEAFDAPNVCIRVAGTTSFGTDMTVAELAEDATLRLPGVEPVPINTEPLTDARLGETVETAGLGRNNIPGTPDFGVRYFATEYLLSLGGDMLQVDGRGMQGVCGGDSGGPVFVIASDGTARVAGGLLGGDASCVDVDNYTRTDAHVGEIEALTGPTIVDGSCGPVTAEGYCRNAQNAIYCVDEMLVTDTCAADEHCDLDASGSYRCVAGADPCGGMTMTGVCEGNVARWCEGGAVRSRDCGTCGQLCDNVPDLGGAYCRDANPCETGELDRTGRCDGETAQFCTRGGDYVEIDCSTRGGCVMDGRGRYRCATR
jgi:hypothetical protein